MKGIEHLEGAIEPREAAQSDRPWEKLKKLGTSLDCDLSWVMEESRLLLQPI